MIIPSIRGTDNWGSGEFDAPRSRSDGSTYKHKGVDIAAYPRSIVMSLTHGKVTKIGWPSANPKKAHLRYVEVTLDGNRFRYMYVDPMVEVGDEIQPFQPLGRVQDLMELYPAITNHVHFEIIDPNGTYINPRKMFPDYLGEL